MILFASEIHTLLTVKPNSCFNSLQRCCAAVWGLKWKEVATPTELQGKFRKEKLITRAEARPSHQT